MISKKVEDALNEQVNKEMFSAYLYMSMSVHAGDMGLKGFSNWFMVQYHEEMSHAMKLFDYIHSRGGRVVLKAIEAPASTFDSVMDMFEKTLAHEEFITASINDLMETAMAEKDHATQIFLQWFVTEQVEEEENDHEIIDQLKLIGSNSQGLMMLDKELAQRRATIRLDFSLNAPVVPAE